MECIVHTMIPNGVQNKLYPPKKFQNTFICVQQEIQNSVSSYLASPKRPYKIAFISKHIKNFKDSSRIPKNSNAVVRNGKVESQEILWFKRLSLLG